MRYRSNRASSTLDQTVHGPHICFLSADWILFTFLWSNKTLGIPNCRKHSTHMKAQIFANVCTHSFTIHSCNRSCRFCESSVITVSTSFSTVYYPSIFYVSWSAQRRFSPCLPLHILTGLEPSFHAWCIVNILFVRAFSIRFCPS